MTYRAPAVESPSRLSLNPGSSIDRDRLAELVASGAVATTERLPPRRSAAGQGVPLNIIPAPIRALKSPDDQHPRAIAQSRGDDRRTAHPPTADDVRHRPPAARSGRTAGALTRSRYPRAQSRRPVIEAFVARIERRLVERAEHDERALKRKRDHQKEMVLGSMGISVPLFAIAAVFTGLAGIVAILVALVVVTVFSVRQD
jgi:hypothetical protein